MISLRPYQRDAVEAAWSSTGHGLVVLPTGAGKSIVLAELARRALAAGQRVAVVTHRRELLLQDETAILRLVDRADVGVVSSGLGRSERGRLVTLWGVATAYRRELEPVDLVVVDEAHLVPREAETMYGSVLGRLGGRRIGLTATPYRLDSGLLNEGDDRLFDQVVIEVPAKQLVAEGWLAPLRVIVSAAELDLSGARKRAGEFITSDLEGIATEQAALERTIREIVAAGRGRRSWLIFGVSVRHVRLLADLLAASGVAVGVVTGETPSAERFEVLERFKAAEVQALVNCEVLTTGFDAPGVDLLVLARPTMSRSLHVQMLGRGMRRAEGKSDCLVLDLAGNVLRHGDTDKLGVVEIATPDSLEPEEQPAEEQPAEERKPRERKPPVPAVWARVLEQRARWYERNGERRVVVVYTVADTSAGGEREVPIFLLPERYGVDRWATANIDAWADRRGLDPAARLDAVRIARAGRSREHFANAILIRPRRGKSGKTFWSLLSEDMGVSEPRLALEAA